MAEEITVIVDLLFLNLISKHVTYFTVYCNQLNHFEAVDEGPLKFTATLIA